MRGEVLGGQRFGALSEDFVDQLGVDGLLAGGRAKTASHCII